MNICFANMPLEYYSPISGGAISTFTAAVARELVEMGHSVRVLTYSDANPHHPFGDLIDLGAMPSPSKPVRAIDRVTRRLFHRPFGNYEQYRRRVRRTLRALRPPPDVVVVSNDFAAPGFIRRALPHSRVVTWLHNELPDHRAGELNRPDLVVAISGYIHNRAVEGGVPEPKVHTILYGVDLGAFHADGRSESAVPRALCIGRLDPNKGFHVALAALRRARSMGSRFEVTLAGARWWYGTGGIGPPAYASELIRDVAELGGRYAGLVPRPDVPALYRNHDIVFVLSLAQEPAGMVILEAMASGCAVIASPRGGIPQLAGGAAVLVDPDDADAVTAATRRLLDDPAELARWQERAVGRAASAPWRACAESFVKLIESLEPM